jgi:hypothetical protein
MKWRNFQGIRKENRWITSHLGNGGFGGSEQKLRDWVTNKVGHIAFRPFNGLDLDSEDSKDIRLVGSNNAFVDDGSFVPMHHQWNDHNYYVLFHLNDIDDTSFCRVKYLQVDSGPNPNNGITIAQAIQAVIDWHQTKYEHVIVFDAVIKVCTVGNSMDGTTNQKVDVFRFPEDYCFNTTKKGT